MTRFADQLLMRPPGRRWAPSTIADPTARYLADAAQWLGQLPGVPVWRLESSRAAIVYIGGGQGRRLVDHLFFDSGADAKRLGTCPGWALARHSDRWLDEGAEVVVCESSRLQPFHSGAEIHFAVPGWINQVIDIPEKLEDALAGRKHRGHRFRINRFLREGFTYHHTRSVDAFEDFYHNMYLPFARRRHGGLALVAPYELQRWWFSRGGLLLVCRKGHPVAGSVSFISEGTCMAIEAGVRDADEELLRQGINTFLVWSHLAWAHSHGARRLNMGGTRPWRSNGSFRAKQEWGATVVQRRRPYPLWRFLSHGLSPWMQERINRIGFIAESNGSYLAVLTCERPMTEKQFDHARREAIKDGADGLLLVPAAARPTDHTAAAAIDPV